MIPLKANSRFYLFTVCMALLAYAFKPAEKVRIFIAGDSTAQTYDTTTTLQRGWGQMLQSFFTPEVKVVNKAIGGRSTKSFIAEERWGKLLSELQKGDYVLIQFGHNDASTKPERHASYEEYKANLERMVNDVRSRGGFPVLLTSVVMRTYNNDVLIDDRLKGYPALTRQVAGQLDVPLININQKTRDYILLMGNESSKSLYMWVEPGQDPSKPEGARDDTHLRERGARLIARMVVEELRKQKIKSVSRYITLDEK